MLLTVHSLVGRDVLGTHFNMYEVSGECLIQFKVTILKLGTVETLC